MPEEPLENPGSEWLTGSGVSIPRRLLQFTFQTSRAPGGQNVNKLATRAVLRVKLADLVEYLGPAAVGRLAQQQAGRVIGAGELMLSAQEFRSQSANRRAAEERLLEMLEQARRIPRVRRATRPTKGSKKRRLQGKSRHSGLKQSRRRPASED